MMSLSHSTNNWASGAQKAKDNTNYSLYTMDVETGTNLNLGGGASGRGEMPDMGKKTRNGETMKANLRCTLIKSTLVHCPMRPISRPFRAQTPHKHPFLLS